MKQKIEEIHFDPGKAGQLVAKKDKTNAILVKAILALSLAVLILTAIMGLSLKYAGREIVFAITNRQDVADKIVARQKAETLISSQSAEVRRNVEWTMKNEPAVLFK